MWKPSDGSGLSTSFAILVPGKAGPALSKGNICVCNARGVVVNDDLEDSKENKKYLKDLKEYEFWKTDAEGTPENKDAKAKPKGWTTPKGTPFVWKVMSSLPGVWCQI